VQAPPATGPLGDLVVRFGGILGVLLWAAIGGIKFWRYFTEGRDKKAHVEAAPVDAEALVDQVTEAMRAENRAQSAHLDLEITKHFDQLRRDLTTTIERAHERSDIQTADAMQRLLLQMETFVKTSILERRQRGH